MDSLKLLSEIFIKTINPLNQSEIKQSEEKLEKVNY